VTAIDTNILGRYQGDQVGRIFDNWAIVFFGQLLENFRSSLILKLFYPTEKGCVLISAKMVWATFWASFSQTHLVTLIGTYGIGSFR
jgi:hypothetical protein